MVGAEYFTLTTEMNMSDHIIFESPPTNVQFKSSFIDIAMAAQGKMIGPMLR